jgi:hypothetical protein
MSTLLDMMNKRVKRDPTGRLISETVPLSESAAKLGLRSQPTDAAGAGLLNATPKQQDMAGAQQTQQKAIEQAQQPTLSETMRTQQSDPGLLGENVEKAQSLIEAVGRAKQVDVSEIQAKIIIPIITFISFNLTCS